MDAKRTMCANNKKSKRTKYQIRSYSDSKNKTSNWRNIDCINITTVKELNIKNLRIPRAGFILYTVVNKRLFIGFGIDSRSHELTDFSGQINYTTETVINGALREFKEETLEIFSRINQKDIENCLTIYNNDNLVIFMNVNINPDIISHQFNEQYQQLARFKPEIKLEVCGITWLTIDEFNDIINNKPGIFYERVHNFLKLAGNFTHLL